jgi:DNA-binding NarL/FixJ family response regulator
MITPLVIVPVVYFTPCQRSVLEGFRLGLSIKQIAAKSKMRMGSAYFHVRSVREKLGIEDDNALVRWCVLNGPDIDRGCTRNYGHGEKAA